MGRGRGRGKGISGGSTLSAPKCQLQELCRRYTTGTPSGQTIGQSHRDRRVQGSLDRDNVSVSVGIGQVRVGAGARARVKRGRGQGYGSLAEVV